MKQLSKGIFWSLGQGFDSNVYVIKSGDQSLLIDSGLGNRISNSFGSGSNSLEILKEMITQQEITDIYLTHGHIDHVGGLMSLQHEFNLKVISGEVEAKFLEKGESSFIDPILGSNCESIKVDQHIKEGEILEVGNFSFEVLFTPGHTIGSTCLWDSGNKVLVTGDTVFPQGSFGRTDLPSGDSKSLINSLSQLSKLKPMILLPGHMTPIISRDENSISKSIVDSFNNTRMMLSYF
ncbi:MAG: MBL fold metallo-hydrolase [Candidatus Hodarchaeales archaeon]